MRKFYLYFMFVFYPLIIFSGSQIISENILSQNLTLGGLVDFFKSYIPALTNFQKNSNYPEIFQILFVVCIFLLPLHYHLISKSANFENSKIPIKFYPKFFLGSLLVIFLLTFYMTIFYGSNIDGVSRAAKTTRLIMSSKFWFSIFTGLSFFMASFFIFIAIFQLKILFKKS